MRVLIAYVVPEVALGFQIVLLHLKRVLKVQVRLVASGHAWPWYGHSHGLVRIFTPGEVCPVAGHALRHASSGVREILPGGFEHVRQFGAVTNVSIAERFIAPAVEVQRIAEDIRVRSRLASEHTRRAGEDPLSGDTGEEWSHVGEAIGWIAFEHFDALLLEGAEDNFGVERR